VWDQALKPTFQNFSPTPKNLVGKTSNFADHQLSELHKAIYLSSNSSKWRHIHLENSCLNDLFVWIELQEETIPVDTSDDFSDVLKAENGVVLHVDAVDSVDGMIILCICI